MIGDNLRPRTVRVSLSNSLTEVVVAASRAFSPSTLARSRAPFRTPSSHPGISAAVCSSLSPLISSSASTNTVVSLSARTATSYETRRYQSARFHPSSHVVSPSSFVRSARTHVYVRDIPAVHAAHVSSLSSASSTLVVVSLAPRRPPASRSRRFARSSRRGAVRPRPGRSRPMTDHDPSCTPRRDFPRFSRSSRCARARVVASRPRRRRGDGARETVGRANDRHARCARDDVDVDGARRRGRGYGARTRDDEDRARAGTRRAMARGERTGEARERREARASSRARAERRLR